MLYLRPQRVYKPSALSYLGDPSDIVDSIIDRYLNKDLYRLRIEIPRGTSITADNSQITCYAHIFDKEDGTELTDLLKGRGYRPTWLLDGKPIDSARISEEGYLLTLETTHLPAIYQTVTLQARDTDILLALTTDENQKRVYSQLIELGSILTNLLKTSEKLLNVSRLDKIRVEGLEEIKQDLAKALASKQPVGSYVDPSQLATSQQQAVDEAVKRAEEMDKQIKVGGRNLLRAGYYKDVWFSSDTRTLVDRDNVNKKITVIKAGRRWNSWMWFDMLKDETTINLRKAIGEYTLSFSVRGRGTVSFEVNGDYNISFANDKTIVRTLTEDWQRVSCPFTRSGESGSLFCLYSNTSEVGDWVQFADDWKLERGTIPTDWTPAPEDVAESVTALSSKLLDPNTGEIYKLTTQLESHKTATDKSFEDIATHPLTVDENGYWRIWNLKQQQYVTTQYKSRGEAGRYLGRAKRIHPDFNGNYLLEPEGSSWQTAKEGDYVYLVGDLSNRGGDKDTYYIVREHTSKTVWEQYDIKGRKPVLTLDSQYHLLADGEMVSMQSLRGEAGHTPELHVGEDDYLYVDGVKQRYVKGDKGDKPVITLNDKYQLLADGELVSMQSLKGADGQDGANGANGKDGEKGADGHTPEILIGEDDYLYVDGIKQRYVKGDKGDKPVITLNDKYQLLADGVLLSQQSLKGEAGHSTSPEDVLGNEHFRQLLDSSVTTAVGPRLSQSDLEIDNAFKYIQAISNKLDSTYKIDITTSGYVTARCEQACSYVAKGTAPEHMPTCHIPGSRPQIRIALRSDFDTLKRQVDSLSARINQLEDSANITPVLDTTLRRRPSLIDKSKVTLYPLYGDWILTSDVDDQYISFSGLSAEVGKSIYIQTRRKAYLYANNHSFYGLPGTSSSIAVNQWLAKNTTYRFVRASSDSWLVTASSSPYPWT